MNYLATLCLLLFNKAKNIKPFIIIIFNFKLNLNLFTFIDFFFLFNYRKIEILRINNIFSIYMNESLQVVYARVY